MSAEQVGRTMRVASTPARSSRARLILKRALFPGTDLATRQRLHLKRYFRRGDILTLDAGCGNGALSFEAYKLGNRVVGINIEESQVLRCEEFRDFIGVDSQRCVFLRHNIYDVMALHMTFDQIICFETLEHLTRDQEVLELFAQVLRPDGVLHLCTPRLDRSPYFGETISVKEDGGHVRLGYTVETFRDMLSRIGFEIVASDTVMGPVSFRIANTARWLSSLVPRGWPVTIGEAVGGFFVMGLMPLTIVDRLLKDRAHLCVYVQARRCVPGDSNAC